MRAWLVRAGKSGEREQWALAEGCTGGGFWDVRDLSEANDRSAVLDAVLSDIANAHDSRARNIAAQLWALRGGIGIGDIVVMPLKNAPFLAIGCITSDYRYDAAQPELNKRHLRSADWIQPEVPRTLVRQDLLYSLGASSTICEISRNDSAWRLNELLAGKPDPGAQS